MIIPVEWKMERRTVLPILFIQGTVKSDVPNINRFLISNALLVIKLSKLYDGKIFEYQPDEQDLTTNNFCSVTFYLTFLNIDKLMQFVDYMQKLQEK